MQQQKQQTLCVDRVKVGSVPIYVDLNDNKNVIIVGTTGAGKTTFANNLLRGMLGNDSPVTVCVVDKVGAHMGDIRDAGLSVISLTGNKRTGTTDGLLSDAEIARVVEKHPRAALCVDAYPPAAMFEQSVAAFRHMLKSSPERRKIIVAEDIYGDGFAGAILETVRSGGESNITVILTAHAITDVPWIQEFAKRSDVRVIVGKPATWGKKALDALRVTKADLEGLDRHKALVAAGDNKATVEFTG